MKGFLFLLCIVGCYANRYMVLIDVATPEALESSVQEHIKDALKRAFRKYVLAPTSHDEVAIAVFAESTTDLLDWTAATQAAPVYTAIDSIDFQVGKCADWDAALESVGTTSRATHILLVSDENPCNTNPINEARLLKSEGISIVPVGIGNNVQEYWLKQVCGPCSRVFGCVSGWHYLKMASYSGRVAQRVILVDCIGSINVPGVLITLTDVCTTVHTTTSNQTGGFVFPGVCAGPASILVSVPVGFVLQQNPFASTVPAVAMHTLEPIVLQPVSDGVIGDGPLSAGEIVAISIMGTIVFLLVLACCWSACAPYRVVGYYTVGAVESGKSARLVQ
jgi:hypothetical protein